MSKSSAKKHAPREEIKPVLPVADTAVMAVLDNAPAQPQPEAKAGKPKKSEEKVEKVEKAGKAEKPAKVKAEKSEKPVAEDAREKPKKPKLVRDSYTIPEAEYKVLGEVKRACLKAGFEVKKSELLRIGLALVKGTEPLKLQQVLASLPTLKAGRPKKDAAEG